MEIGHGRPSIQALYGEFLARIPHFCCFCHQKTDSGLDLCRYCRACLPSIVSNSSSVCASSLCLNCGYLWPDSIFRKTCARCVNHRSPFNQIICPFRYDFPVDGLISRLKYRTNLSSGRLLGGLLAEDVKNTLDEKHYPELILPIPLNAARYQQRGFNQAAELAHWCGRSLGVEVCLNKVGRRLDTGSLAGLSRSERGLRIRGAFWADESLVGRRVAIVDDVLTTGATAGELATELLDQGAEEVQLWVVARTPFNDQSGRPVASAD